MDHELALIAEKIRAAGYIANDHVFAEGLAMYAPLHDESVSARVDVENDAAYGFDARHRVDIYRPKPSHAAPHALVLHLPSGGFYRGDKADEAMMGRFFADCGCVFAIANYRLAPQSAWPAGREDAGRLLSWALSQRSALGGTDIPVFLMGYSAGASHACALATSGAPELAELSGLILMSGAGLDLTLAVDPQTGVLLHGGERAYFGADPARYAKRSPIARVPDLTLPVFIAYAEYDPRELQAQTHALIHALFTAQGVMPSVLQAANHNHGSILYHFTSPDKLLGDAILRFMERA
ncbi:MAG: alpha/beta hydrolase [Pseudomonadota bacterium]